MKVTISNEDGTPSLVVGGDCMWMFCDGDITELIKKGFVVTATKDGKSVRFEADDPARRRTTEVVEVSTCLICNKRISLRPDDGGAWRVIVWPDDKPGAYHCKHSSTTLHVPAS